MKVQEPPIIVDLKFSEYNEEMTAVARLWVNPPLSMIDRFFFSVIAIRRSLDLVVPKEDGTTEKSDLDGALASVREAEATFISFLQTVLSKDPDEKTHWTEKDIKELGGDYPKLYDWFIGKITSLVLESVKKS